MRLLYSFILVFGFFIQNLYSQVSLPPIFGDNMVFKQNSEVKVWGVASPNSIVEIRTSWDHKKYETYTNDKGFFSVGIQTVKAGGPYSVEFYNKGKPTVLKNILLGEVWFCSGQSNMEMAIKGFGKDSILKSKELIADSDESNIRIFTTVKSVSFEEKENAGGKWEISNPESAAKTSAVAWQFAKKLQQKLGVPVAVIISAWGGTPIKSWMSRESLKYFPSINLEKPDTVTSKTPAGLFNGMVAPISPFSISGILWYQGENDHKDVEEYRKMLPAMVQGWRLRFENEKLPFYFVQIAPWLYERTGIPYAAYFREMQYQLSKSIPFSGIAVTTDIGSNKTIHPPDKTSIAERLVNLALSKTYGKRTDYLGPEYTSMRIKNNRVILSFRHAKGLHLKDVDAMNFLIAGKDRKFHKAEAIVKNGKLEVWAKEVKNPESVRYAFDNFNKGNLFNGIGLPASTFRTDHWPIIN